MITVRTLDYSEMTVEVERREFRVLVRQGRTKIGVRLETPTGWKVNQTQGGFEAKVQTRTGQGIVTISDGGELMVVVVTAEQAVTITATIPAEEVGRLRAAFPLPPTEQAKRDLNPFDLPATCDKEVSNEIQNNKK
jgi:hypothetical protein